MKKGIVIVGVILFVIGLVMTLFMWPCINIIDEDEASEKMDNSEEGTYQVVTEIDDDEWKEIEQLKKNETALELAEALIGMEGFYDNVDGPGTYTYRLEINGPLDFKMSKPVKVPTIMGLLGLVITIVGIILLIVGVATGRAAPVAPAQPPMEQPPYEQPPYQQPPYQEPPMQQPPYQQPPPQQPPMPPPPP